MQAPRRLIQLNPGHTDNKPLSAEPVQAYIAVRVFSAVLCFLPCHSFKFIFLFLLLSQLAQFAAHPQPHHGGSSRNSR